MGSTTFYDYGWGKTAEQAFEKLTEEATYENGHGGYTGTIAEKNSFIMISLPVGQNPDDYSEKLIDEEDERVADTWGDAGCIIVPEIFYNERNKEYALKHKDEKLYLFFGWASD